MNSFDIDDFRNRLKKIRRMQNLTQEQLAKHLPVTRSTYAYYESGKTMPDIPTVVVLAKIFGCSLDHLLTGMENEPNILLAPPVRVQNPVDDTGDALLPDYEQRLLEAYRHLSFSQKRVLLLQAEKMALDAVNRPK